MRREVSAHIELNVSETALLALQIGVATPNADERLTVVRDGEKETVQEVAAPHGGRIHMLTTRPGNLMIDYAASVDGEVPVPPTTDHDLLQYRRPSRYCPSDRFLAIASSEFGAIEDTGELVRAVARWVQTRLFYTGGSSRPTDDSVDTLLLGEGVCRDYAHLVLSLLRAKDVPARLAAVYAPGLDPMDFHAVVEAWVDGAWRVVDATGLAPRPSMLRIATGRDTGDTAFLSVHHGIADLVSINVLAVVDTLPQDDPSTTVTLT